MRSLFSWHHRLMGEADINQTSGMHSSKVKETKQLREIDHIKRNPTGCLMMSG